MPEGGRLSEPPREIPMSRIAVLDDYQRVALSSADWSGLEASHEVVVFDQPFVSLDAAASALQRFDVIAIMRERTPFSKAMLDQLPALKLLVTTGHRNAAIDMAAATARGVVVCGTEAPGHATAELAFGMIIAAWRNLVVETGNMAAGRWQTTVGRDLKGATLGLIGLGKLGAQMARYGQAFGMHVLAWSQNLEPAAAAALGVTKVDKDQLFARSDAISIHTKLSSRTEGLVGARELSLMKRNALLINTSRGPIIDEAALLKALHEGTIGGAAIDVYDSEPLPATHPLRSAPRTLLTPHIGYVTAETYRMFYGGTVAAIEAWAAGRPIHVMSA
jgi:phosphoglycerate dehydrogenase-like enzyme